MSKNVSVDARGLMEKFKRLDVAAQAGVKGVIHATTLEAKNEIVGLLDRGVSKGRGGKQRSRPGQPPRTDTGREKQSVTAKTSPKGWVGTVSTDNTAADKKGRRYPWMLESGTKTIAKRPLFKRVQRKLKKPFQLAMANAMSDAVRKANR